MEGGRVRVREERERKWSDASCNQRQAILFNLQVHVLKLCSRTLAINLKVTVFMNNYTAV